MKEQLDAHFQRSTLQAQKSMSSAAEAKVELLREQLKVAKTHAAAIRDQAEAAQKQAASLEFKNNMSLMMQSESELTQSGKTFLAMMQTKILRELMAAESHEDNLE